MTTTNFTKLPPARMREVLIEELREQHARGMVAPGSVERFMGRVKIAAAKLNTQPRVLLDEIVSKVVS